MTREQARERARGIARDLDAWRHEGWRLKAEERITAALLAARDEALEECAEFAVSRAKYWREQRDWFPSREAQAWAHDESVHIYRAILDLKTAQPQGGRG